MRERERGRERERERERMGQKKREGEREREREIEQGAPEIPGQRREPEIGQIHGYAREKEGG